MALLDRVFAVVSNSNYFPGLWALLNSILVYHRKELKVFVFSHGLTPGQLCQLNEHPINIEVHPTSVLPFPAAGTWEAKQQVYSFLMPKARHVVLLDADLVLTSAVDDVFEFAAAGKIVSSNDGDGITFTPKFATYSPALPGLRAPYFNSGLVGMNLERHWDLVGLWAFASQYATYSVNRGTPLHLEGHGDQGLLNAISCMLGKQSSYLLLPAEQWCDSGSKGRPLVQGSLETDVPPTIINACNNQQQRLLHSTGPKWWTDAGRKHLRGFGDKLRIFTHFYELLPRT